MLIKIGAVLFMTLVAVIMLIVAGIRRKNSKMVIIPIVAFLVLCALAYWGLASFITSM